MFLKIILKRCSAKDEKKCRVCLGGLGRFRAFSAQKNIPQKWLEMSQMTPQ
jgi:hypothetical protein